MISEFAPLNRFALLDALRKIANARCPTLGSLRRFFPHQDVRAMRMTTDPLHNRVSWDRMIVWLGQLGYTVEFRLVPKRRANDERSQGVETRGFPSRDGAVSCYELCATAIKPTSARG